MNISRRHFLGSIAGTGIALTLGGSRLLGRDLSTMGSAGQPLRIPPLYQGGPLVAARGVQRVWPDLDTPVMTLGGSHPAPTIRVRSGESFSAQLVNQLDEPTNIHWHGLIVPPAMDGHPRDVIAPGESFTYSFTVAQRAGTYWYHPHGHMLTARQVYSGMAGLFIVEDEEEQGLGLPSGDRDLPLVIQDRRVAAERSFTYAPTEEDHVYGYLGDTLLVNGTPDPYLEVEAGLYRFRVLNASTARVLYLGLSENRPFHIIANDGGLLDRPYEATRTYLSPGERVELLVDFSDVAIGASIMLMSFSFGSGEGANGGPEQGMEMPALRFDIVRPATATFEMPSTLVTVDRPDPATAAVTRGLMLRIVHGVTEGMHTINGRSFDMERIDGQVRLGDLEIWEFQNVSFLHHPMHLHGAQFQVLTRNGSDNLLPGDLGWKDTVRVRPGERVRLLTRFAPWPGVYLAHCHNLEHEDHGMMMNYEVVDRVTAVDDRDHLHAWPDRMDLR